MCGPGQAVFPHFLPAIVDVEIFDCSFCVVYYSLTWTKQQKLNETKSFNIEIFCVFNFIAEYYQSKFINREKFWVCGIFFYNVLCLHP